MDTLDRLASAIERLIDRIGRLASWLELAIVFLLFVQNLLREWAGSGQFFAKIGYKL
jgi:hypothetical protein